MEQNTEPKTRFEANIISPPRVIVKFQEGMAPPYQSEIEGYDSLGDYIQENGIGPWTDVLEKFPGISVKLIFVSVDPATIQSLVETALGMDCTYQDPNFLSYFAVGYDEIPEELSYEELYEQMQQIRDEFSSWESVELAYVQHGLGPLPASPTEDNNDRLLVQDYLNPATLGGVSAKHAWDHWVAQSYPDAPGFGINFIDIERGWDLEHQDLITPLISLLGNNKQDMDHGTSTLGVVVGRDNGDNTEGIVGLAYQANATVSSVYPTAASIDPDHHNSIMVALARLTYGDVLLIEEQATGDPATITYTDPETGVEKPFYELWPVEIVPDATSPGSLIWEVIYLATTLGIIIIEPAGNGFTPEDFIPLGTLGNDLASFTDAAGQHILDRDPTSLHYAEFKDSRAIIVGSATKGDSAESYTHYRTFLVDISPFRLPSNYGKRIDCFGWGQEVLTSGGGPDNNPTHNSYRYFNGTSSASAMIAGVALVIQSFAIKELGYRLGPIQMRSILSDPQFGSEVYGPGAGEPVEGYLPDLKKILDNYFNVPHEDIFIRDNPTDVGNSNTGLLLASPDIIVRNSPSSSNYITNPNLDDSHAAITGTSAFIYVRAFNRGNAPASNVTVSLYYSDAATLNPAASWQLIAKNVSLGTIPAKTTSGNGVNVVSIPWNNIPGAGPYCFMGLVGNVNDPLIDPKDPIVVNYYNDMNNFSRFIRANNNAALKNSNVVQISAGGTRTGGAVITGAGIHGPEANGSMKLDFFVVGANDRDRPMELEIVARFPKGSRICLQGRTDFLCGLHGIAAPNIEPDQEKGTSCILVNPYGPYRFNVTLFPKDLRERLTLIVDLPKEYRNQQYELYARQLYQGAEVGRVTWQLTPRDLIRVNGLTPVERRCIRLRWLLVGLLALFVVVTGLHPWTGYLAEIIVGLGAILAGSIWYQACRPDKNTILKEIALGLGIGFVLLAWGMLAGLR